MRRNALLYAFGVTKNVSGCETGHRKPSVGNKIAGSSLCLNGNLAISC